MKKSHCKLTKNELENIPYIKKISHKLRFVKGFKKSKATVELVKSPF